MRPQGAAAAVCCARAASALHAAPTRRSAAVLLRRRRRLVRRRAPPADSDPPCLHPACPDRPPPFHPAVDVFSFGLLLHYCLTAGKHPFGAGYERDANILQRRLNLKHLQHLPEAANLVRGCCAPKGALRCVCWGRTPGWSLALAGGRDLPHTCPGAAARHAS